MSSAPQTSRTVTLESLRARRDEILAIAVSHGASNVRIFGSVARGEADKVSDLDVLVDMNKGRSLLDLAGFHLDLEDLLGVRVDVVTVNGLRERVREDIAAEAVPL